MLTAIKPKKRTILLYLLVPVAMFVFTVFVPLVTALVYSFYEWKGGPQKTFTGLANYITLFHDGTFWQAFGHNIYLVVAYYRADRYCLCFSADGKFQTCQIKRDPSNLWFLSKHNFCSLPWSDLEHDLP